MTRTTLAIPPDPRGMLRRIAAAARQAEHPLRHWWAMPARMNRAVRGLADNIHPQGTMRTIRDMGMEGES